jgi:hypothetical protein
MWSSTPAETEAGWDQVEAIGSMKDYYNPNNIHNVIQPPYLPVASTEYWEGSTEPSSTCGEIPLASVSGLGLSAITVCGFHMHAIEWHTILEMEEQEDSDFRIALVRRASCPRFNLSMTRWLNIGLNTLELMPFNDVNCFCNTPMVVSCMRAMQPNQPQEYDLVCANRDVKTLTPGFQSCSRVAPVNTARYVARQTPVHTGALPSDLWLQTVFEQGFPPEFYFLAPDSTADHGPKSILASKNEGKLDFSKPPRPPSPSSVSTPEVFCPQRYLASRKELSFRDPVHEISPSMQEWGTYRSFDRFSASPENGASTDAYLYRNGAFHPGALSTLRGHEPYGKAIQPSIPFGVTSLSSGVFGRRLDVAAVAMIHWNDRQEIEDKQLIEDMRARTCANEESVRLIREEHADLVQQIKDMKLNVSSMPRIKCKVCYEGILTEFLLPCGHMVLCKDCLRQVVVCPICRKSLTGTQRISWGSKVGGAELALRERYGG